MRLEVRVLGALAICRDGAALALPRSRKMRALLGFLALNPGPVGRSRLCDLLWDVPNDPRGELRWCLSKLRSVLGEEDQARVATPAPDHVALDLAGCFVDARAVDAALEGGVGRASADELATLAASFSGDLLEGLNVEGTAEFHGWLSAQRQHYRSLRIAILEELVRRAPAGSDDVFRRLETWLQLAPFDRGPHEAMLEALVRRGRPRDAEAHLAGAVRLFEEQALDATPLRDAWRRVRDEAGRVATADARPSAAASASPSSLVGREREWAALAGAWRAASEGRASLLLVIGEPGIGKTRLVDDFVASAARAGATTARAGCYLADRPMAYAAVADWLRSPPFRPVVDALPPAQLSQLARVLPGILMDRPDVPPPAPITESWQRGHFFEALGRALLAAPQPLLVMIDDVQWCDPETLEWVHHLLRLEQTASLLVVATARTGDIGTDHPVAAMLRDLRRDGRGVEIALGPLSAADSAQLAERTGSKDVDARRLYEKTRGNALFIVELARAGLEHGEAVPPKVHAVISTRFSQLGAATREVASVAAVVGRPATPALLAHACGRDEDAIAAAIDELFQRRVVRACDGGAYEFTHGLLRDVCYAELGPERCRSLHRRVAIALGAVRDTDPDLASSQIAEHFERGGQAWEAVPHLERAASVVRQRYAEREAIAVLERALRLLEQVPRGGERDEVELRLLTSLSQALMATRGYAAAEVGETLARARERHGASFPLLFGSWIHHVVRADLEDSRSLACECLELAKRSGDSVNGAASRFALGCSLFHLGRPSEAAEALEAIGSSSVSGEAGTFQFGVDLGVFWRVYLAHTRCVLGDASAARQCSHDALARAEELAHPFSHAVALAYDAMLQQFLGDPELTLKQADAATALCTKYGFLYYLSWMPMLRGWARARRGAVSEGLAEMREGYAALLSTGAWLRAPYYLALMAAVALDAGDAADALRMVGEARAIAARTGERWQDQELARLHDAASKRRAG